MRSRAQTIAGAAVTGSGLTVTAVAIGGGAVTGAVGAAAGAVFAAGAAVAGAATGGLAITGPAGGLLAIAGGGATIVGPCLTVCGRILLGAGGAGGVTAAFATGAAVAGCAVPAPAAFATAGEAATTGAPGLTAAAGATVPGFATTGVGRAAGWLLASASCCLRSRIAFSASPGFEMCERLNAGFVSAPLLELVEAPPRRFFRYSRTRSASLASIELECVFGSVTPTAVRASRMDRLLTSSSRARSLIRTLLIRPFSLIPDCASCSYQPLRSRNCSSLYYP